MAVGLALAIAMQRFRLAERALLPYMVLSQTVPLVALAPVVVGWAGSLSLFGLDWQPWMSVVAHRRLPGLLPGVGRGAEGTAVAGARVGRADGLATPPPGGRRSIKLRFPASVPYLVPALKLAAAAAVVGAVVAEISTGTRGGIGRLIIEYSREGTGDPAKVFTAILGAAVLGLRRRRPRRPDRCRADAQPAEGGDGMSGEARRAAVEIAGREQGVQPGQAEPGRARSTDIDLTIEQGEFVSLIGPSGCGKSTLLRLIANLTDPTTGSVTVNGKSARQARLDQDYGMAFQQSGLFEWRTVAKNIELPLELQGLGQGQAPGPRPRDARPGQAARVRRPPAVAAVRRHAAAGRHRPRAGRSTRRCC